QRQPADDGDIVEPPDPHPAPRAVRRRIDHVPQRRPEMFLARQPVDAHVEHAAEYRPQNEQAEEGDGIFDRKNVHRGPLADDPGPTAAAMRRAISATLKLSV